MRRDPLGQALREAPIPLPAEAERRGRAVVEAAYAERAGRNRGALENRRPALPRLALALSTATLLAALLLTPAGAAVRDWVDDAITSSTPRPQPELAEIPGGGRLLVQSASGPWVVQPDGSRRLLGDYEEATWSPRGLFVGVADGRTLSAVEPDGTPRWSLEAPGRVSDPRWSPSPGERIAYRAGAGLWVVAGDGTEARKLATATAPVAPAWSPIGAPLLAYVSAGGMLRIADSESGEVLAARPALSGIADLEWSAASMLESSPRSLRLRTAQYAKLAARPRLRGARRLPVPAGARVVDAALSPRGQAVAAVLTRWREHGTRSSVVVFGPGGRARRLLTVPGSLGEVAWSPDGRRLLIAWPYANQWLFLPVDRGEGRAVANVSTAFAPGQRAASFPRLEAWCCRN
jgi:dipeptidyl aminopeptidase/acylaminoacyl peptidase